MIVELFIFEPKNLSLTQDGSGYSDGLKVTAKRYTTSSSPSNHEGLTLLFTHCVGMRECQPFRVDVLASVSNVDKEIWEPIIERIYSLQHSASITNPRHRVREVWSFDWQTHGEAAVINRVALEEIYRDATTAAVSIAEWAQALSAFLKSPLMKGHRVVGVGHSAGAGALMLSTSDFPIDRIPYTSLILVEATIVTQEAYAARMDDREAHKDLVITATTTRRAAWPNKESAFTWLRKRFPWNMWNPKVLKVYTEHGLHLYASQSVLKCNPKHEALSYRDDAYFEAALQYGRIGSILPVHVIWGTRNDVVPDFIQEDLTDASQGRRAVSITKISDAGHLMVQEDPDRLADAICKALSCDAPTHTAKL